jgi:hypothetical protein
VPSAHDALDLVRCLRMRDDVDIPHEVVPLS